MLAEQSLASSEHERKAWVKQLEALDARNGAREEFVLLADTGIVVMALLNGARSSTKELLTKRT